MAESMLNVLLFVVGAGALLLSYVALSPIIRDLVFFMSR
jgi:hypothetical protein